MGRLHHRGHLQTTLAGRTVLQTAQTTTQDQNLRRHQRQRGAHADLDSIDRYSDREIPPIQIQVWLGSIQPRGLAAMEPIQLPRPLGMD